jgi:hypothetical protein
MRVYILLYNAGTENEGIHTLQTGDRNIILMFESEDDAIRYALLLEAQDFPSPTVEEINSIEIEEFCRDSGYDYKIVDAGMLEIPPEHNLDSPDWSPEGKRNYDYGYKESTESDSEMSKEELDRIRRQFEGLFKK